MIYGRKKLGNQEKEKLSKEVSWLRNGRVPGTRLAPITLDAALMLKQKQRKKVYTF